MVRGSRLGRPTEQPLTPFDRSRRPENVTFSRKGDVFMAADPKSSEGLNSPGGELRRR
jgi:hypothetical protein